MYSAMVSLCLGLSLSQAPNQVPPDVRFFGHREFRLPLMSPPRPEMCSQRANGSSKAR